MSYKLKDERGHHLFEDRIYSTPEAVRAELYRYAETELDRDGQPMPEYEECELNDLLDMCGFYMYRACDICEEEEDDDGQCDCTNHNQK